MLFHSQLFVFLFLPLVLGGYYLAAWFDRRSNGTLRHWFLIVASFVFYGYWDARLLPLLAGSVAVNWVFAALHTRFTPEHGGGRWLLPAGIAVNLLVLGIFKYADFFGDTVAAVFGTTHDRFSIVLPLGISFFTFQQISYLADLMAGRAPLYNLRNYVLYVTFFPQLIAGPIVRHNQIIGQYRLSPLRDGVYERLCRGFALFTLGLAAKVLFADKLAEFADEVFAKAEAGSALTMADGWAGMAAFGLQIFFDFGGYSTMAIGLGMMMGLFLPQNFNVPYIAASIRTFWRRWHMTLSSFLRDYLYIPLGGSRHGPAIMLWALMATMLLGGLWHGAGWTFIAWGGLHGLALVVNHLSRAAGIAVPLVVGWVLTQFFVFVCWVVFRAESFDAAGLVYQAMLGMGEAADSVVEGKHWWRIAIAAGVSVFGWLHNRAAQEWMPPRPSSAIAVAGLFILVTLFAGDSGEVPFIYFQF